MVVGLGHAVPFAIEFQEQEEVGEVDGSAPAFFEDTHHGNGFFHCEHVDTDLESVTGSYGIDIAIELFDRAALSCAIEYAEQYGVIGEQSFCIFAVAFGHTLHKLLGGTSHCCVFLDIVYHIFKYLFCFFASAKCQGDN